MKQTDEHKLAQEYYLQVRRNGKTVSSMEQMIRYLKKHLRKDEWETFQGLIYRELSKEGRV